MSRDAEHVDRLASGLLADLERQSRAAPPASGLGWVRRWVQRAFQAVVRKGRQVVREHWDLGVFDVSFGSLKAFGVYPALYRAGLAWTIPIMEGLPLNTQLWTAGYLVVRRHLLSALGSWRYGYSLERLDALRRQLLDLTIRPSGTEHVFCWQGARHSLWVRRNRWLCLWERLRGKRPVPGAIAATDLRRMVSDAGFLHHANGLRGNAFLYERILIQKILASNEDRPRLLALSVPTAAQRADRLSEALRDVEPIRARLDAEQDLLAATLRRSFGGAIRASTAGLRWLYAAHRSLIRRRLGELREVEYRLLAQRAAGNSIEASPFLEEIEAMRDEIRSHLDRASRLVHAVARVRSEGAAERLLRAGLRQARSCGLEARRAHLAERCSARTQDRPLAFRSPAWRMDP
jgi:hypothetical protein